MSDRDPQLPPPSPDDRDIVFDEAELDRTDAVLRLPATWAEPAGDLEQRVLGAWRAHISAREAPPAAAAAHRAERRWRTRVGGALAGAAAAAIVFGAIAVARRPAPPKLRVTFAATSLLPNAGGKAALTETNSGWRIKLDTTGLDRLANGRYYEAWFEGPKGIVSIGTFHAGVDVTLWAGVEADEYTTLVVTIEQEDGNPAQSPERVLTAPLTKP